jgi:hypothetical protein
VLGIQGSTRKLEDQFDYYRWKYMCRGTEMISPRDLAIALLQATSLSDEEAFRGSPMQMPGLTIVDYHRIACRIIFECERCGTCCTTGDPIRLKHEDASNLARHLKIPQSKFIKKYTIPDPKGADALAFKKTVPCKFFDTQGESVQGLCSQALVLQDLSFSWHIRVRGRSQGPRVLPRVCQAMKALEEALEEIRSSPEFCQSKDLDEIRRAKAWFSSCLDQLC